MRISLPSHLNKLSAAGLIKLSAVGAEPERAPAGAARAVGGVSVLVFLFLLALPARAIDPGAGTGGAQFLKMGQGSARAMALGKAYVALAEGTDSLTWNPAGLAVTQQKELAFSYLRYIQDVQTTFGPFPFGYMAYAHPMGRTVWGANMAYMKADGFDVRDANGVPQDASATNVTNGYGSLGIARSFWYEKLFLGGTVRLVHEDIAGSSHDTMVGDLGFLLKPNNTLSLGFALQNFGSSVENVPSTTRGGAALRISEFMTLALELSKAADAGSRVGLGAEFQVPEQYLEVGQLTFRAGYYKGDNLGQSFDDTLKTFHMDRSSGLSFGFGLYTSQAFGYGLALDYAFVPYGALGTVDQISLKLKF